MKVGIVGMGAAGIYAAKLLTKAGADVRCFEARDRLGGRLHTVCDARGPLYDAGGEWLDADHERTLELARDANIPADPQPRFPGWLICGDQRRMENDLWPEAIEDEARFDAASAELAQSWDAGAFSQAQLEALDQRTLASWIDEHATTDIGKWWLTAKYRSDEGDEPARVGLLGWLSVYRLYMRRSGGEASAFRLKGGMGALFERVAADLTCPIYCEKTLQRVVQTGSRVSLQFDDGETSVDCALLTLPPQAIERVAFDPPLPNAHRCALEAFESSRASKICLEFDRPWWHEIEWSGSLHCDLPIQQTWDGSKGEAAILNCYVCGDANDYFHAAARPVHEAVEQLSSLFHQARERFVSGIFFDWPHDSFSSGGFGHLPPGYQLTYRPHVAQRHGLVSFAGEYASEWFGFIEGALESAERAVGEILGN